MGSPRSTTPAKSPSEHDSSERSSLAPPLETPATPKPKTPKSAGSQRHKSRRLRLATGETMYSSIFGATPTGATPTEQRSASHRVDRRRRTVHVTGDDMVDVNDAQSKGPQAPAATFAPKIAPPACRPRRFSVPGGTAGIGSHAQSPGPQASAATFIPTVAPPASSRPRRFSVAGSKVDIGTSDASEVQLKSALHQRSDRRTLSSRSRKISSASRNLSNSAGASTRASSSNSTSTPMAALAYVMAGANVLHPLNLEGHSKSPTP